MKLYQIRYDDGTIGDRVYKSYKQAEEEIMNRGYINVKVSIRESRNYTPVSKKYYSDTGDDYMYVEEVIIDKIQLIENIERIPRRSYFR